MVELVKYCKRLPEINMFSGILLLVSINLPTCYPSSDTKNDQTFRILKDFLYILQKKFGQKLILKEYHSLKIVNYLS